MEGTEWLEKLLLLRFRVWSEDTEARVENLSSPERPKPEWEREMSKVPEGLLETSFLLEGHALLLPSELGGGERLRVGD